MNTNYCDNHIYNHINNKSSKIYGCSHYAIFISHKSVRPTDIVTIGFNSTFTKYKYMTSTHAEMDAMIKIKNYKNKPKKLDLYIFRISSGGKIGSSCPCYHCMYELEKSRLNIINVYYFSQDGIMVKRKFKKLIYDELYICSGMRIRQRLKN